MQDSFLQMTNDLPVASEWLRTQIEPEGLLRQHHTDASSNHLLCGEQGGCSSRSGASPECLRSTAGQVREVHQLQADWPQEGLQAREVPGCCNSRQSISKAGNAAGGCCWYVSMLAVGVPAPVCSDRLLCSKLCGSWRAVWLCNQEPHATCTGGCI